LGALNGVLLNRPWLVVPTPNRHWLSVVAAPSTLVLWSVAIVGAVSSAGMPVQVNGEVGKERFEMVLESFGNCGIWTFQGLLPDPLLGLAGGAKHDICLSVDAERVGGLDTVQLKVIDNGSMDLPTSQPHCFIYGESPSPMENGGGSWAAGRAWRKRAGTQAQTEAARPSPIRGEVKRLRPLKRRGDGPSDQWRAKVSGGPQIIPTAFTFSK
jgi:hypothetical protein